MTFPKTGGTEWAGSQASPWTPHNEAVRRVDALASRAIIVDRDLTAPPGSCADGANYLIAAAATGAWAGQDGKLATAVGANAANGWLFQTVAVEGYRLYVQDEDAEIVHDGSAWGLAPGGAAPPHTVGMFFTSTPTANEVLLRYEFAEGVNYADDFAGSRASVGTNPTASFALTVNKNGSPIGTITIGTGGSITFATTGGAESFADDDLLTIAAPGTPDATVANVAITLKGTRA